MTITAAATLVTEPISDAPAPPEQDDDVIYDPGDDLLPPPKPADQCTTRPSATALVVVPS